MNSQTRVGGEIIAAVRQPPAGQLERRVFAKIIQIIGIRVAAGSREDASAQSDKVWVIRAGSRWSGISAASVSIRPRRLSAPANSRTPPSELIWPASKAAVTFFLPILGRAKGQKRIVVVVGGHGGFCPGVESGVSTHSLCHSRQLYHARQRIAAMR
jgi:hypothetical protein